MPPALFFLLNIYVSKTIYLKDILALLVYLRIFNTFLNKNYHLSLPTDLRFQNTHKIIPKSMSNNE